MKDDIILLIRHGRTERGAGKRFIGQYDVELSAEGVKTSNMLGEILQPVEWQHLFSSALQRSASMAEILGSYAGLEVKVLEGLNEICLGTWEGRLIEDIRQEYPEQYLERGRQMIGFRTPGGENYYDLQKRVLNAFSGIRQYHGNLIITGHTSVNRVILGEILGIPLEESLKITQDYGACNIIVRSGNKLSVRKINADLKNVDLETYK